MVSGQRHETTQRRSATAIHIPVALCDAPGVKTKILSTKKGPGCKHRSRSHGESGEVFLLDTLSHRMSETAIFRQLTSWAYCLDYWPRSPNSARAVRRSESSLF